MKNWCNEFFKEKLQNILSLKKKKLEMNNFVFVKKSKYLIIVDKVIWYD